MAFFTSAVIALLEILMIQFLMHCNMAVLCLYWIDILTALVTKINPYVKITHKVVNSWGKWRYVYITLRLYYYFDLNFFTDVLT